MDMIPYNPADRVDLPRQEKFIGEFYDADEALALFEAAKGHRLELAVLLATVYGLRHGEIVGLKWRSIDFKESWISIEHKVVEFERKGEKVLIASDNMKTISSRSMPLIPKVAEELMKAKQRQEENKRTFKKAYSKDKNGYVCVDAFGNLLRPNYVSMHFSWLLKKRELRAYPVS